MTAHETTDTQPSTTIMGRALWLRVLGFVSLCVGVFVVRAPFIAVPLTDDEGAYAFWASTWTPDHEIFRDFYFARPQALLVLFKIILATLGGDVEAIRVAGALATCLTACAIWAFARELFSERAAWLSAACFAVFSAAPRIEGFTSNAEIFTLAPLVLNAHLVWKRQWFAAGLVTAIAFQLKPSAVEGCFLIAIWIFVNWRSLKQTAVASALSLGGFMLGLVPAVLHGIWIGWDDFYFNMVTIRNQTYAPSVVSFSAQIARIQFAVLSTFSSWVVPALLFAVAVTRMPRDKRLFCLLWLFAAFLGMQAGFWWNWHFFMQIVPPLCFAAGAGILGLSRIRGRWVWIAATALALWLFAARDARLWFKDPYQISWQIWHREEYLVSEAVSEYVAKTTRPDDLLYIAFGQAEIYYLSGRRPAVPNQLFYNHARYFDEQWRNVIAAITRRKPALIIWAQPPPMNRISAPDFAKLILQGYRVDRKFGHVMLFRRKPS